LVTRDGHAHDITVLTVEPATIRTSDNERYQYLDVLTIERRSYDRHKNLVLGITAGALAAGAILLANGLCVCTQ
jgi:hypothetical protein